MYIRTVCALRLHVYHSLCKKDRLWVSRVVSLVDDGNVSQTEAIANLACVALSSTFHSMKSSFRKNSSIATSTLGFPGSLLSFFFSIPFLGIGTPLPLRILRCGLLFFITILLNFAGFNFIRAHVKIECYSLGVHNLYWIVRVITAMSSIKALAGGWMVPDADTLPRFMFSVLFIKRLTVALKMMTEIVQPFMIFISRSCQEVV